MIEILSVRAGILKIPSCTIHPGICAIAGPNGAGKTTFLKLLSGILPVKSGSVRIDGKEPSLCTIGWVGEYPDRNILFPRVYDELASPLRFTRQSCESSDLKVRKCADDLGITHLLDRDMHGLSGGELILVAFAAACIASPDLLILDETDSHLDERFCHQLEEYIRRSGIRYVVFSTHRPERMAIADEMIRLVRGEVGEHLCLTEEADHTFPDHLSNPWFWRKVQTELSKGGT
ncbi:ABC transporter ATP-binding protein [Methanospirillum hungatei]|uniref:ABC transporter ATP-binding protein n=1 Tax=Methanospirillum hungatei TaxID=2203 RepID=UPI0026ED5492|nr:ABC transporter ATP-binding protein [Methanospirillum hungatei]MCA1915758.1 energy-coupling factor ABC transporter ATP-binding protein [Methanospirillum hungatei]